MCVGACLMARISQIVYGCREPKWGALGSQVDLVSDVDFPHPIRIVGGVLAEESASLLKEFFRGLRGE